MRPKTIAQLIIVIATVITIVALSACTTTKKSFTHAVNSDSLHIVSLTDSVNMLKIEYERLEQINRENQFITVVFDSTQCPKIRFPEGAALMNKDSIQKLINNLNDAIDGMNNKINVDANGAIQANGKIKQLTYSKDKLIQIIQEKDKIIDSLGKRKFEDKTDVKKSDVTTITKKKTTFLNFWWLLIVGFAGGYIVRAKTGKIIPFI